METAAILLIIWAGTMNYAWFRTFHNEGNPWHWKIFLGPAVYENHIRNERNHDLRVVEKVTTAAADDWRKRYIYNR